MNAKTLNLIAPNSEPIVGVRLSDGTLSDYECTYDNDTRTFMYLLPPGNTAKTLKREGSMILVDAKGNEWHAPDVEYHSVLHGK